MDKEIRTKAALVLLLGIGTADLEISELVSTLGGGNYVQEISQLLFLQILLGQILQVSLGKGSLGVDNDLGLLSGDGHLAAELAGLAVHLDSVVKELLERGRVQHLILHRGGKVNGELRHGLLAGLLDLGFLKQTKRSYKSIAQKQNCVGSTVLHASEQMSGCSLRCLDSFNFTRN